MLPDGTTMIFWYIQCTCLIYHYVCLKTWFYYGTYYKSMVKPWYFLLVYRYAKNKYLFSRQKSYNSILVILFLTHSTLTHISLIKYWCNRGVFTDSSEVAVSSRRWRWICLPWENKSQILQVQRAGKIFTLNQIARLLMKLNNVNQWQNWISSKFK